MVTNFPRLLNKIQNYINDHQSNITLVGDFNIGYLKIGEKSYQRHLLAEILLNFQILNSLGQNVKEITKHRIIEKNKPKLLQTSFLDHVYSNNLHIDDITVHPTLASGHDLICVSH